MSSNNIFECQTHLPASRIDEQAWDRRFAIGIIDKIDFLMKTENWKKYLMKIISSYNVKKIVGKNC